MEPAVHQRDCHESERAEIQQMIVSVQKTDADYRAQRGETRTRRPIDVRPR